MTALQKIGLDEQIKAKSISMYGRTVHLLDNSTSFHYYGNKEEAMFSVSRNYLNYLFLEEARKYENIKVYFNSKIVDFDI